MCARTCTPVARNGDGEPLLTGWLLLPMGSGSPRALRTGRDRSADPARLGEETHGGVSAPQPAQNRQGSWSAPSHGGSLLRARHPLDPGAASP